MMISVVCIFMVANIACGFAPNARALFVFRAFTGIGVRRPLSSCGWS
jgi:MFS family permease